MTWVKLDDGMLQHPKIAAVGALGFAVHVAGIVYCGQNLTDGFVPYGAAIALLNFESVAVVNGMQGEDVTTVNVIRAGTPGYQSLEDVGLWRWEDAPRRGWWLHDYLVYNPCRKDVLADRDKNRVRMQLARSARERDANTDGSVPNPGPVPVPVPLSVSPRASEVFHRMAQSKMDGRQIKNRKRYLHRVLADLEHEHGTYLEVLLEKYPNAPTDALAGALLGEPNSLHRYA